MSAKADTIKATLKATRQRRQQQTCHVYQLKVDRSRLSHSLLDALSRLFLEAKWFYNAALSAENYREFDARVRQVPVLVKDQVETRDLTLLSSQMKQGILSRLGDAIHALAVKKAKGFKVGALKFRSEVNSIPLKQFGVTYRLLDGKHIALQGFPAPLKVFGLKQLAGAEKANANLIKRGRDFFLHVTAYREKIEEPEKPHEAVGIDFNIEAGCQMVCDNEVAVGFEVRSDNDPRIQGLQRKLARQDRGNRKKAGDDQPVKAEKPKGQKRRKSKPPKTKNRAKTQAKLQKAYEALTNKKQEIRNQVVRVLRNTYQIICFQEETLKGWQRWWGKRVHGTALGGILSQLQALPTSRVVKRFVATTQTCHGCGFRNRELTLNDKWWTCPSCGTRHNRHVNAACNARLVAGTWNSLPRLEQSSTSVESCSSAESLMEALAKLSSIGIQVRRLVETDNSLCEEGSP
jgi:putative transposase